MGKAAGPDDIPAELMKACPATVTRLLIPVIKTAWNTELLPDSWKEGYIIKLPKKGNLKECRNWRGITLLNTINKIIAIIILNRLSNTIEPTLRAEQAGFRPQRSCIDQINALRIVIEQSYEFRSPLYLIFVDFERAFDTLKHTAIWAALRERGVPEKIIRIIKALYHGSSCKVIHSNMTSKAIPVRNGVKQGCVLSPLLFNIVLDEVMTKTNNTQRGIRWGLTSRLEDLDYADDICLLSHSLKDAKAKLTRLAEEAEKVGLRINNSKTKEMRIMNNENTTLTLNNRPIERVQRFTYLGSVIDTNGGTEADVKQRILKAQQTFGILNNIWRSRILSPNIKIRLFNTNIKSVLLYGCETWKVTKSISNQLQVFTNKCLRKILRIYWPDQIPNTELWERAKQTPIEYNIKRRKWGWLGHTLRKPAGDIAKQALDWNPQGSRGRGRPRQTWRRTILEEAKQAGKSWGEIKKPR